MKDLNKLSLYVLTGERIHYRKTEFPVEISAGSKEAEKGGLAQGMGVGKIGPE